MIFTIKFKKCMTDTSIFSIIIPKLSYWKKFSPIVLFKVDKNSKIGCHNTILSYYLAMGLRIKSSGKSSLNT